MSSTYLNRFTGRLESGQTHTSDHKSHARTEYTIPFGMHCTCSLDAGTKDPIRMLCKRRNCMRTREQPIDTLAVGRPVVRSSQCVWSILQHSLFSASTSHVAASNTHTARNWAKLPSVSVPHNTYLIPEHVCVYVCVWCTLCAHSDNRTQTHSVDRTCAEFVLECVWCLCVWYALPAKGKRRPIVSAMRCEVIRCTAAHFRRCFVGKAIANDYDVCV